MSLVSTTWQNTYHLFRRFLEWHLIAARSMGGIAEACELAASWCLVHREFSNSHGPDTAQLHSTKTSARVVEQVNSLVQCRRLHIGAETLRWTSHTRCLLRTRAQCSNKTNRTDSCYSRRYLECCILLARFRRLLGHSARGAASRRSIHLGIFAYPSPTTRASRHRSSVL